MTEAYAAHSIGASRDGEGATAALGAWPLTGPLSRAELTCAARLPTSADDP